MNHNQFRSIGTPSAKIYFSRLFAHSHFLRTAFLLGCVALTRPTQAADGGVGTRNTAEGTNALFSLSSGTDNTAIGYDAMFVTTTNSRNTASGSFALFSNKGSNNTATGYRALQSNSSGHGNTATGSSALISNTVGDANTAVGDGALYSTMSGTYNVGCGLAALQDNTTGDYNTGCGAFALDSSVDGSGNIALGFHAGGNLVSGSDNIDIGNTGVAGDSGKIRIGTKGTHTGTFIAGISGAAVTGMQVVVNSSGKLGVAGSSARFKKAAKSMDKASEAIHQLQPVTFRYKEEIDPDGIPQFGLIAEDVEKVNPDLVVRDENGKPFTVRYEAVNAMLLNEFLKERSKQQTCTTVSRQSLNSRASAQSREPTLSCHLSR